MPTPPACRFCRFADDDAFAALRIHDDGTWLATVHALRDDMPSVLLQTRRHNDGLGELAAHELATLGTVTQGLVARIEATTGGRAYLLYIGEECRHFHLALIGRPPGASTGVGMAHIEGHADAVSSFRPDDDARRWAARLAEGSVPVADRA